MNQDISAADLSTEIQVSPDPAARRAKVAAILETQVQACDNVMGDIYAWLRRNPERAGGSAALGGLVSLARVSGQLAAMLDRIEPLEREKKHGSNTQENY